MDHNAAKAGRNLFWTNPEGSLDVNRKIQTEKVLREEIASV